MYWALNRLKEMLGEEEYQAGITLYQRGGVREASTAADQLHYHVAADPAQRVSFYAGRGPECTCMQFLSAGCCRHLAAATAMAQQSGALERMERQRASAAAPRLMSVMESALPEDGTIRLEVTLLVEKTGTPQRTVRVGLRIGEERMYVVRSIPQLIEAIDQGTPVDFGKGFSFRPEWMRFAEQELQVIGILRSLCAAQKDAGLTLRGAELRLMKLPEPYVTSILDAMGDLSFRLAMDQETPTVRHIRRTRLPLHFKVTGNLHGLTVTGFFARELQPLTLSCSYVVMGSSVVAVPADQQGLMRVLWQEQSDGHAGFTYAMRETPKVIGELIPFLKLRGVVEIAPEVDKLLEKLPLVSRIYLDRDGREVVARTQFCYGSRVVDPFDETPLPEVLARGEKLLLRDALAERQVLDALGGAGFRVARGRVYLAGQDHIYRFVSGGLQELQEKCEVYASRDFQRMTPRRPVLQGQLRMDGGRLQLDLTESGQPSEEILGIMEALAKRKQYYRLKDGSFLDLSEMDDWQPVADVISEAAAAEGADRLLRDGGLSMSGYRLCYLTSLLEHAALPVTQDEDVRQIAGSLNDPDGETICLPDGLNLRPYQQRGFRWLHTLDRLHMGGILADDMGLGKTVQMIAMLKAAHQEAAAAGKHVLSLVVSPTSLTYNWLSELERFAP